MTDHQWIRIVAIDSIPPREGRAVTVAGREIAIFNLGDRFLAVDNQCPHKGGPLADGIVAGDVVVCPLHAWRVDLTSGCVERPSNTNRCVRSYTVRVDEGVLMLQLPTEGARKADQAA